jgi:pyrroline-5-carboxylate reductase
MLGKVVIVGGGKMGEVIVNGIISNHLALPEEITVTDILRERREYLKMEYGIESIPNSAAAARNADILILAVKPQGMVEVLKELASVIDESKLVISIAAGIPIKAIEEQLGESIRVIRVMPNTPALVGEGAAALAMGKNASKDDMELAKAIFDSVGIAVIVDEKLMDAVTGLSGSGPAYAFIVIEALSDAGVYMGLSREVALKLAAQTMLGAAKLCLNSEKHIGELRDMVTSPGGTTISGIKALEEGGIRATLIRAVEAAALRSKELGKI